MFGERKTVAKRHSKSQMYFVEPKGMASTLVILCVFNAVVWENIFNSTV
jgi:hypothetical protein